MKKNYIFNKLLKTFGAGPKPKRKQKIYEAYWTLESHFTGCFFGEKNFKISCLKIYLPKVIFFFFATFFFLFKIIYNRKTYFINYNLQTNKQKSSITHFPVPQVTENQPFCLLPRLNPTCLPTQLKDWIK